MQSRFPGIYFSVGCCSTSPQPLAKSLGRHSDGNTPKGKPGPAAPGGMRHGLNDYTKWFAGDKNMGGDYMDTMVRVRHGTTCGCTTMCSPFMPWMCPT